MAPTHTEGTQQIGSHTSMVGSHIGTTNPPNGTNMGTPSITRPLNIDHRLQRNMSCELFENDQVNLNRPNSNNYNRTQNNTDCSIRPNNLGVNCGNPSVNKRVPVYTNVKIVGINVCGIQSIV